MVDVLSGAGQTAVKSASDLGGAIYWFLLLAFAVLIIVGIVWYFSYGSKKFRAWEELNSGKVWREFKAKEYKDRDGVTKWSLWEGFAKTLFANNKRFPKPPKNALYPDNKGKVVGIGYIKNDMVIFPDEIETEFSEDKLKSLKIEAFSSEDKSVLVNELRTAEEYKKKKLGDLVLAAAPYMAMVIIVVCFMLFFNKTVQPSIEMGNQNLQIMEKYDAMISKLDVLINNRQYFPATLNETVGVPN